MLLMSIACDTIALGNNQVEVESEGWVGLNKCTSKIHGIYGLWQKSIVGAFVEVRKIME
jgi:hypothetical protein